VSLRVPHSRSIRVGSCLTPLFSFSRLVSRVGGPGVLLEALMGVTAIHPGEHLAEELQALDMSAAELARKLDVPTNRVTQILNGTRAITGDTALRLAHFFGTSPQFWLNLQSLYELRLAQQKAGRSIKALPKLKRREPVPA
jgi:addiction module HigA family antidote